MNRTAFLLLSLVALSCTGPRSQGRAEEEAPNQLEVEEDLAPTCPEEAVADCEANADYRGCTTTSSTREHCGRCGQTCSLEQYCEAGQCVDDYPVDLSVSQGIYLDAHQCAAWASGRVSCWGKNTFGQLGDGTTWFRKNPFWHPSLDFVKDVEVGRFLSCVLVREEGDESSTFEPSQLQCWGGLKTSDQNQFFLLAEPTTPPGIPEGMKIVRLQPGPYEGICALNDEGHNYCINSFSKGFKPYLDKEVMSTIAKASKKSRVTPIEGSNAVLLEGVRLEKPKAIREGGQSCVLLEDYRIYCEDGWSSSEGHMPPQRIELLEQAPPTFRRAVECAGPYSRAKYGKTPLSEYLDAKACVFSTLFTMSN